MISWGCGHDIFHALQHVMTICLCPIAVNRRILAIMSSSPRLVEYDYQRLLETKRKQHYNLIVIWCMCNFNLNIYLNHVQGVSIICMVFEHAWSHWCGDASCQKFKIPCFCRFWITWQNCVTQWFSFLEKVSQDKRNTSPQHCGNLLISIWGVSISCLLSGLR